MKREYHVIGGQVNEQPIDFQASFRYFGEEYLNRNTKKISSASRAMV